MNWEDGSIKCHERWPEKRSRTFVATIPRPTVTKWPPLATNRRLIGNQSVTTSDKSAGVCDISKHKRKYPQKRQAKRGKEACKGVLRQGRSSLQPLAETVTLAERLRTMHQISRSRYEAALCLVLIRAPTVGSEKGGLPDLLRFPRFLPICSDLLRFLPICSQNKSGKPLSADPFCKSPISSQLWTRRSLPVLSMTKPSR